MREADEERLLRLMKARLNGQLSSVMETLGDPPDWGNLDYEFWQGESGRMLADLRPEIERMAVHAAATPVIPASVPILWDEAVIFREAAQWATQYAGRLVTGITDNTREAVGRAVQGFVETPGRTIGQLRTELTPLFGQSRAQRIAVTETSRAYAEGTRVVQEELGRAGIQMEQVWRTSMDERVCPICGPNADKRKSEGWTVSGVPAHPNCRCWVVLDFPKGVQAAEAAQAERFAFVPANTKEEVAERMRSYAQQYDLGDLPLSAQNDVLRSVEDVCGRYNANLRTVGYQTRNSRNLGTAQWDQANEDAGIDILLQKTALRNAAQTAEKTRRNFELQRRRRIELLEKVNASRIPDQLRAANERELDYLSRLVRWTTGSDASMAGREVEALVRHELYHVVDHTSFDPATGLHGFLSKQYSSLRQQLGLDTAEYRATLSEYASSSSAEFFAEAASAMDLGLPISERLIAALREILSHATK